MKNILGGVPCPLIISVKGLDQYGCPYGEINSNDILREGEFKWSICMKFGDHEGRAFPSLEQIDTLWERITLVKGCHFTIKEGELLLAIAEENKYFTTRFVSFESFLAWAF